MVKGTILATYLEGLRNNTKTTWQDSWSVGQNMKQNCLTTMFNVKVFHCKTFTIAKCLGYKNKFEIFFNFIRLTIMSLHSWSYSALGNKRVH